MLQLLNFFSKNKTVLLFLLLEFIAFIFIINSHSFHHSKYINSANAVSGSVLKNINTINNYFSLNKQNEQLILENKLLKNKLELFAQKQELGEIVLTDSINKYNYISAKVISNPYNKRNNILTIDKGSLDGVKSDMGIIVPQGIVGTIIDVSKHYATVLSMLNGQSKINPKMKGKHHYGSLNWNGLDYRKVTFEDLPIQANIKQGDTVISGGKSIVYPAGIPIGIIADFEKIDNTYQNISIDLFTDFSALYNVYVVINKHQVEQKNLEQKTINE